MPLALGKDARVSLGPTVFRIDSLAEALREFKNARPGYKLELKPDEGAPLGLMVKVWDAATVAGLEINDLPLRILLAE